MLQDSPSKVSSLLRFIVRNCLFDLVSQGRVAAKRGSPLHEAIALARSEIAAHAVIPTSPSFRKSTWLFFFFFFFFPTGDDSVLKKLLKSQAKATLKLLGAIRCVLNCPGR